MTINVTIPIHPVSIGYRLIQEDDDATIRYYTLKAFTSADNSLAYARHLQQHISANTTYLLHADNTYSDAMIDIEDLEGLFIVVNAVSDSIGIPLHA